MVGKGMGRLGRGPDTREIMAWQHGGVLADHAGGMGKGFAWTVVACSWVSC